MSSIKDTRTMTIVDLPLVRRLNGRGTVLDSEMGLTRDARGQHSWLLSSLLFPRGLYTLVARSDDEHVVGQFRYRPDDTMAHIVYIAPTLDGTKEDTVWLHILDAMVHEAGKHGAHSLVAEVETNSMLFETLRTAGFATYARQTIWRHEPFALEESPGTITLTEADDSDMTGILSLVNHIVPTMLQQIAAPHSDMGGWIYRKNGRVEAYIGVSEGTHGVYLLPYLHPDVAEEGAAIITATIAQMGRADKVPVYVCVRTHQSWLDSVMQNLSFDQWVEQAVMVKQITAGIHHPSFDPVKLKGNLDIKTATPKFRMVRRERYTDAESLAWLNNRVLNHNQALNDLVWDPGKL